MSTYEDVLRAAGVTPRVAQDMVNLFCKLKPEEQVRQGAEVLARLGSRLGSNPTTIDQDQSMRAFWMVFDAYKHISLEGHPSLSDRVCPGTTRTGISTSSTEPAMTKKNRGNAELRQPIRPGG